MASHFHQHAKKPTTIPTIERMMRRRSSSRCSRKLMLARFSARPARPAAIPESAIELLGQRSGGRDDFRGVAIGCGGGGAGAFRSQIALARERVLGD